MSNLRIETELFYSKILEKRELFSDFVNEYLSDSIFQALSHIQSYIDFINKNEIKCLMWIGGGRSWNVAINCFYKANLNRMESNAIFPGNFDIFIICKDPLIYHDLVCYYTKILLELKQEMIMLNHELLSRI